MSDREEYFNRNRNSFDPLSPSAIADMGAANSETVN